MEASVVDGQQCKGVSESVKLQKRRRGGQGQDQELDPVIMGRTVGHILLTNLVDLALCFSSLGPP